MAEEFIGVTISTRQDEALGIAVFELVPEEGGRLPPFSAGAHIDLHVAPEFVRQYSLCNPPGETHRYRIGVLKDPASRGGSQLVHSLFQPGHRTKISPPRNLFPLAPNAGRSLLIGGGIGITPMIAMAYSLKAAARPFELHYCCRSADRAAFVSELQKVFGAELNMHFDDGPLEQRFDPQSCFCQCSPDTHIYICGPAGFMDWAIAAASAARIAKERVHFEYFSAAVDRTGAAFEVHAKRSDVTLTVAEGQSILDALTKAGIKVKKSCEQGVCGTCLCDVLEGVPDHKDQILTDDEKQANDRIAVCCSRSKTPRLVLDV